MRKKSIFVLPKVAGFSVICVQNELAVLSRARRNFFRVVFSSFFPLCGKYLCIGCRIYLVASYHSMVYRECLVKCSFWRWWWWCCWYAHHFTWLIENRTEMAQWKFVHANWNQPPLHQTRYRAKSGNGKILHLRQRKLRRTAYITLCAQRRICRDKN